MSDTNVPTTAGHSLCSACIKKVSSCPNCRGTFRGARNYTLENLTTKVRYPCHNRDIGCSFAATSDKIRDHEVSCQLSENYCLLKCDWKGLLPDMYIHLTELHRNCLREVNEIYICDITDNEDLIYVFHVHSNLFRFSITWGAYKRKCKYNIQHVGMIKDKPKFRYKLQIIDQSRLGLNLSITNVCQCLTKKPNEAHKTGIDVPYNMLQPFIFDERFYYFSISISKF